MPDEVVAFDESGHPSFNRLQNYGSSHIPIYHYVFDLLMLSGRDLMSSPPLDVWRHLLQTEVLSGSADPIRFSPTLESTLDDVICSVREQRFEGLSLSAATAAMSWVSGRALG